MTSGARRIHNRCEALRFQHPLLVAAYSEAIERIFVVSAPVPLPGNGAWIGRCFFFLDTSPSQQATASANGTGNCHFETRPHQKMEKRTILTFDLNEEFSRLRLTLLGHCWDHAEIRRTPSNGEAFRIPKRTSSDRFRGRPSTDQTPRNPEVTVGH